MAAAVLAFVWAWTFHLLWVWLDWGEAWVSLLIASGVVCALGVVRAFAEAAVWSLVASYSSVAVEVGRTLLGYNEAGGLGELAKEPAVVQLAALMGWAAIELISMASDATVTRAILLSVGLVVLVVVLLRPLVGGGGQGSAPKSALSSLPLPTGRPADAEDGGKLKFVLRI